MRSNPYIVQALKYATLTLLAIVVVIVVLAIFRTTNSSVLTGRLVNPQVNGGEVPTMTFSAERAIEGFTVPADIHVFFTVPEGIRIPRITFFGGPDYDLKRYWGYCFSGNENRNKAAGLTGKAIYDGQFFYSLGERKAQSIVTKAPDTDLVGILNDTTKTLHRAPASIAEIFYGGKTCYVMTAVALFAGIDLDNDEVIDAYERALGTDPYYPDTDRDGIPDGTEVFVTKTNPKLADTDQDGLPDRIEDKNANGRIENDETSPLNADTDRDKLCDGGGRDVRGDFPAGCPEARTTVCTLVNGNRQCKSQPSSPANSEDANHNGIVDKGETDPRKPETFGVPDDVYKYRSLGIGSDSAVGTPVPEFPIPNF